MALGNFLGIYGPQSTYQKSKLWDELLALKISISATWIFMGDFNVVCRPKEEINSVFFPLSANAFNQFIRNGELTDLKMGGQRFTFFKTQGAKLSKLDWFLVCSRFLSLYPFASCFVMDRDLYNHSPIILRAWCDDFGLSPPPPPTFKLYKSWILKDRFEAVVRKACYEFVGYGILMRTSWLN